MASWSPTDVKRCAVAIAGVLLVGACASVAPTRTGAPERAPAAASRPAPPVNLSGYNAAFKEGYADGCSSARQAPRRNAQRYGTDTDYTMGWNDGHAMCGR